MTRVRYLFDLFNWKILISVEEEDMFESDFESTDEEAAKEEDEAGDRAVHDEEKRARKVSILYSSAHPSLIRRQAARSKLDKVTAAAHAKHKETFNPQAQVVSKSKEMRRRVSLGTAVNAETGEVILPGKGGPTKKKRHSQRKHTILSTSAHVKRMKRSEEKKVCLFRYVRNLISY
jgi:YL1 nuclear protein